MFDISISIVSHRQIQLVQTLLGDLHQYCSNVSIEVILTVNVDESFSLNANNYEYPIQIVRNAYPKGFGENHNAAFRLATGRFFCVLNPDIRLLADPFPPLIEYARQHSIGVVAPRVINKDGIEEDNARKFPSPLEIVRKVFGGKSSIYVDSGRSVDSPDCVAGMFMLFPREVFQNVGGFDERYFLYYEDVDICARLTIGGYQILMCPMVSVIHDARRSSHKSLRYMRLHLISMLRFFSSSVYRKLQRGVEN